MRPRPLASALIALVTGSGCSWSTVPQPSASTFYCSTDSDCPGAAPGSCRQGLCAGSALGDAGASSADSIPPVAREAGPTPDTLPPVVRREAAPPGSCSVNGDCGATEVCIGGACVTPTWNNVGQSYMTHYCTWCHGWMGSLAGVQSDVARITYRIQVGTMPPAGSPMPTAAQNDSILRWLATGPAM